MSFAYTQNVRKKFGALDTAVGTYTSTGGSTGGDIVTGLTRVFHISLTPSKASVAANASVANETFPLESGTVTIVTDADQIGTWMAIGE